MSERVWHEGPPPFQSWWLTKDQAPLPWNEWRYWNGAKWSIICGESEDGSDGSLIAARVSGPVKWTDYWPADARVPRLDPTGGHWTFNVDGTEPNHQSLIDLAFRSGFTLPDTRMQHGWRWSIEGSPNDILAWRPAA